MTSTDVPPSPTFLSEIFPLTISQPNLTGFRLTPEVDKEVGNRVSFHLSRQFPELVVTWHNKTFWVLGKPDGKMPSSAEWKEALKTIKQEVEDFKNSYWSFQWLHQPSPTPQVLAQLAVSILTKDKPFPSIVVEEDQKVQVRREVKIWPETIELQGELQPGFTLSIHSRIFYKGTLAEFYENHPFRQDSEKLLIGLKVQDIEKRSLATIVKLAGTVGEHRDDLIERATGSISKEALINASANQPLVAVKFGKNKTEFTYAMAALNPRITEQTDHKFGVDYGKFKKKTKIPFKERQELLSISRKIAQDTLESYGFNVAVKCINSRQYQDLFWLPTKPLENTLLLFGNDFKGIQKEIILGLKNGVYKRHNDYSKKAEPIKISFIKFCDIKVATLVKEVEERLKNYGFNTTVVNWKTISLSNLSKAEEKLKIEQEIINLLAIPTDIILVFLPLSDRYADNKEEGSFYSQIYSLLLNRRIASQFIYEHTLKEVKSSHILNQVIPGILAKLGNLPFVLAEPLEIADYFIGLDISRYSKQNLPGTLNACASVRLYGKQGEFHRYRLEGDIIEGEEIPQRLLEKMLPEPILGGKTVLIYRDGRFVNREVDNFLARAKAINANFILVECRKSQIPRLYNLATTGMKAPTQGLALRLSQSEAIVVTTKFVNESIGVPRPLRLNIIENGHPASIESVVDTTLKLTLLHHGALKTPRLPMPLYGADRMAYLRLNGIYPSVLEGDRQFWL